MCHKRRKQRTNDHQQKTEAEEQTVATDEGRPLEAVQVKHRQKAQRHQGCKATTSATMQRQTVEPQEARADQTAATDASRALETVQVKHRRKTPRVQQGKDKQSSHTSKGRPTKETAKRRRRNKRGNHATRVRREKLRVRRARSAEHRIRRGRTKQNLKTNVLSPNSKQCGAWSMQSMMQRVTRW